MNKKRAILTISSNNYLHYARTLMQSVAKHHPEAARFCAIADADPAPARELQGEFTSLVLGELDLPDGDDFLFRYDILELNTAIKPWAIRHLLERGYDSVVYLDPDILVLDKLSVAFEALEEASEIVLTPHLLAPVSDHLEPSELTIRRSGTYNLGFCGVASCDTGRRFLEWWSGKLRTTCINDQPAGIFVDQSWIDLVPGLFPNVMILRHPGYNVAYWNLAQRELESVDGRLQAAGAALAFFHFSGIVPGDPTIISKHQNRFSATDVGSAVADLFDAYRQSLDRNGRSRYAALPYGYGFYDDGTPIAKADRIAFRCGNPHRHRSLASPFASRTLPSPREATIARLAEVYGFLLGRAPEAGAIDSYLEHVRSERDHRRLVFRTATSKEARARRGWRIRLLCWPFRKAFWSHEAMASQVAETSRGRQADKRLPAFEGLGGPEPSSVHDGFWVGPYLRIPPVQGGGRVRIAGHVDLGLLQRAGHDRQMLEVRGAGGLMHECRLTGGEFTTEFDVPPGGLARGLEVVARAYAVPAEVGLGADSRRLAWRVRQLCVGDRVIIDCARDPAVLPVRKLAGPPGVNIIGYLTAEHGVGEAVRSVVASCQAQRLPFSTIDLSFQTDIARRDTRFATDTGARYPIDILHVNADQTERADAYLRGQGHASRYRIGYWLWEQCELPDTMLGAFASLDEVWAPSTFIQEAISKVSPVPVVRIPYAITCAPAANASRAEFGLPDGKLLALLMYDLHSYQYRKNPDAAIAAFRMAASRRDDVMLVVKTVNVNSHPAEFEALASSVADLGNVTFITEQLTRQQTWNLQWCCDFLISLHRAEGYGLVPAEMMYLGKPVVATGWSANTDFMTAENSFPVRYQLKPLPRRIGPYQPGLPWAEADVEHAAACIGRLLDSPDLRRRIGATAAADIRRNLSPEAVGNLIADRLGMIGVWRS